MSKSTIALAMLAAVSPHSGRDSPLRVPIDRLPVSPADSDPPARRPEPARAEPSKQTTAEPNLNASEAPCFAGSSQARSAGLINIAPDGTGTTARSRECTVLAGTRKAAQVGRAIEISDGANGPLSGPGISTADSASYALSLVNVRPNWATSGLTGETDGLSVFVRQAKGDTAAFLANVGVRSGFATTLESFTFAADDQGRPTRAVRAQLGVVNSRDGGEYGLVLQAANGDRLGAGLRIASLGAASWENYLEAISPTGERVAYIRGDDGAIIGGGLAPTADLQKTVGTPDRRYLATYTQVLNLAEIAFAKLPKCGQGAGAGALAFVSDAPAPVTRWGQIVPGGGGKYKTFVKCDGANWTAF